jgi:MFS superfamily sulfate permease-like transporter
MKSIVTIVPSSVLVGILMGICVSISMSGCTSSRGTSARVGTVDLTEDEKHRLYAAALAASEFPLESKTFKEVCKKIGIFDAHGNQSDNYMRFVTAHLERAMKTETEQFKREINTREKAREYLNKFPMSENPALTLP